jgi:hypothetical protein
MRTGNPLRSDLCGPLGVTGQAGFLWLGLDLEDGTTVRLKVESRHGKLLDAFAVSSFPGNLLPRLK